MLDAHLLTVTTGVDYSLLKTLLAAGKWKEADLETTAVILKAANRESEGWCTAESLQQFPCEDLQIIEQLWQEFSQGHFGFAVQIQLYLELGEDFTKLGDRVGWRVNGDWLSYPERTFSLEAPVGHLPSGGVSYKRWNRWVEITYATFAHRFLACRIQ